ncbi:MAG: DNA/RNA nuclease SfsA [Lentihominibacter sp.]
MMYDNICKGIFRERHNRFVASVEIDGKTEKAHVKNTGRCRELLVPGAVVYLEDHSGNMHSRKLRYSLIAVEKCTDDGIMLVNMDSQAPNKVVREALEMGKLVPEGLQDAAFVKSEYTYGDSRMDFYIKDSRGKEALLEVKGVTLEKNGEAAFPDAPTERGIRHINELVKAVREGYSAAIVFVIQMKGVHVFRPNYETHKAFGDSLKKAAEEGVEIMAYDCRVERNNLEIDSPVEIELIL